MSGLFSGLSACVSGLNSVSKGVNCVSQNIASADAIAGKRRQTFVSSFNSGLTVKAFSPGGVQTAIQQYISSVGNSVASEIPTHMALTGQGFFITSNNPSPGGNVAFTRVGTFQEDFNSDFVNTSGQYLQVIPTDALGNPTSSNLLSTTQLVTASSRGLSGKAQATTIAEISGALYASEVIGGSTSKPIQVFDSLGIEHTVNFTFTKTAQTLASAGPPPVAATQTWTITPQASPDVVSYDATYTGGMTIVFDDTGVPLTINGANAAPPTNNAPALTINWNSTAAPSTIALNFGNIGQNNGISLSSNYDMSRLVETDGRPSGRYNFTTIDVNGLMSAHYDNGLIEAYAKIPLAIFEDADQLLETPGATYQPTSGSGDYLLTYANSGGTDGIASGSYEQSDADTTDEFTSLIIYQQLFQANLKGISVIDDMLKALVAIGR